MRIACPRCDAAITIADRAAGKAATCPKCRGEFRVPDLEAEPVYDEIEIVEPPPKRPSKPVVVEIEDDEPEPVERKPRRKSKPRRPKSNGVSPGLIAALIIGFVVLSTGVGGLTWWLTRPNDLAKPTTPDVLSQPAGDSTSTDDAPKKEIVQYGPLPQGWSYNPPSFGFKAAWPVAPGADQFAPETAFVRSMNGLKPNGWGMPMPGDGERGLLSVSRIDLLDTGLNDDQKILDNYVAKRRGQLAGGTIGVTAIGVNGKPGRELRLTVSGTTVTQRITIAGTTLWMWDVKGIPPTDDAAIRFLDSFRPF
jgi:hypothetical protein